MITQRLLDEVELWSIEHADEILSKVEGLFLATRAPMIEEPEEETLIPEQMPEAPIQPPGGMVLNG